jgi:hypothetical protein
MLSAYSENTRKVFKRIWRIWRIVSEYAERINAFLHNIFQVRETVSKVSIVIFFNRILTRFYFARKKKILF